MQPTFRQTPPQYFSSTTAALQAELGGADGGDIAARACAEYDDVEALTLLVHGRLPSRSNNLVINSTAAASATARRRGAVDDE